MKVVTLGQQVRFNIPSAKWTSEDFTFRSKTVEVLVHEFLIGNFNGYTVNGPVKGYWRSFKGSPLVHELVYEVKASFKGKEKLPKLQKFLAGMCTLMQEECLYVEYNQEAVLIYP